VVTSGTRGQLSGHHDKGNPEKRERKKASPGTIGVESHKGKRVRGPLRR
jgi:hypothetical protein